MAKSDGTAASLSSTLISNKTFPSWGNIIRLLPTGTVFMFQFLNPILTSNGHCGLIGMVLTSILIGICGFSCAFACFTDSYRDGDGMVHYGITTATGLWPSPCSNSINLSKYKLRVGDFVHAFFSVMVFAVLSMLDSYTMLCFHRPFFESTQKVLLVVLPSVIGSVSCAIFMVFPNTRHGIGYHPTSPDGDIDHS
ncbi:DUF679 domain membrane protein 2, Arabidopsis thaliana DUF679 domain membrane protein 2 [Hibiscus trionum]|uniref:DUF679 domain membrane protein 2, Arabidopsis thaliana DUF679 domain membrane protein 2 n=1 Tax=Hibiscus trionum TaxID=183268 RepID=A0A9W7LPG6_HIBTR|nr:DUF679 domain membrane protein 2, Arabidopsis thaliana DUF679 domain membrane protein 2 [Hibiscus trionum]